MGIIRICMKMVMVFAVLSSVPSLCGQKLERLRDGEPFAVRGRLESRYRGWHRYLIVQLDHGYLADFGRDVGTKEINELELNVKDGWLALTDYVGKNVEARGTLQIEGVSPYYWNGVMLTAKDVKLEGGLAILPNASLNVDPMPAAVTSYIVTIYMKPQQMRWPQDAVDLTTGRQLSQADPGSCGLNGGGDVMNCFCADGLRPIRAGVVKKAYRSEEWRLVPAVETPLTDMAQFVLEDPDAAAPQTVQFVCQRK